MIEAKGYELEAQVWIEAVELSPAMFHLAYIQLTARGLAGLVICGNSLSMETCETALTATAPLFLARNGDPFAKQKQAMKETAEQRAQNQETTLDRLKTAAPTTGWTQPSLFDLDL